MAAPSLRDAYDCVVLGSSTSAHLLTTALAQAGLHTLVLQSAHSPLASAWLQPRFSCSTDASPRRSLLSGVQLLNTMGRLMASLATPAGEKPVAALPLFDREQSSRPQVTHLQLADDAEVTSQQTGSVEICSPRCQQQVRASVVIQLVPIAGTPPRTAIGGLYRGVTLLPGEDRQALLFATTRGAEVFWLVPQADGLCSLGLLRAATESTGEQSAGSELEEALVACPALTQRLIAAQLVGGLHQVHEEPLAEKRPDHWLTLPDCETWIDPVFASGHWLLEQLLPQVMAAVTSACANSACVNQGALPSLRQIAWQESAQQLRTRIDRWYRPEEMLKSVGDDLATSTIYSQLLASERASEAPSSTPPSASSFSWEARGIFAPRRALLSL
ncbi:hypothetical protein NA78x_000208 [Anatilimnocola sp. NA78]|uniref:hypothetical protein n=1 Tax=Anatilimnocola sp. NA78 TaxID=3415683 RepID=UPI003CE519D3